MDHRPWSIVHRQWSIYPFFANPNTNAPVIRKMMSYIAFIDMKLFDIVNYLTNKP